MQMGEWIVDIVGRLGYIGIALLAGAIAAGSFGSVLGTMFWYWLGVRIGERRVREWAERRGKWLTLDGKDIDKASAWFHRHGAAAVFICRMIPGLRTWISLPAGFSGMPMSKFLLPTVVGTIFWTTGLTMAGYLLGQNYRDIDGVLGTVSWVVIGLIVVAYVIRLMRRTYPGTRASRSRALHH
jgi:membrane protein DedA with SNARE-associated domain